MACDVSIHCWYWCRVFQDKCQANGGKCYSTSDCCSSYVCAAFDDLGKTLLCDVTLYEQNFFNVWDT